MAFWINGSFQEDVEAININERGFLLGDGIFETLLVCDGVAAFQDEHLARLQRGLAALKIVADIPENFGAIVQTLIKISALENTHVSVRISVTRGPSDRGLKFPPERGHPTILMTACEAPQVSDKAGAIVTLKLSQFSRQEKSISARHKTLNYLDNVLAHNEALRSGADDAIMLNGVGRIACASTSNIYFLDEKGVIRTPPIEDGALPGIVRAIMLHFKAETGIEIGEAPIELAMLQEGQVFLSNSLTGLRAAALAGNNNPWPQPAFKVLRQLQTWYNTRLRNDLAARAQKL